MAFHEDAGLPHTAGIVTLWRNSAADIKDTELPRPASARTGWEQRRTQDGCTFHSARRVKPPAPGRATRKPCAPPVEHARLRLALQHEIRAIRPHGTMRSRPIFNWSRPQPPRYQHRFSTLSGNDGK